VRHFVLDASVALAWVLDKPVSDYAVAVKTKLRDGQRGVVPALWHLEIANGLATAERRQDLTADDVAEALNQLELTATRKLDTELGLVTSRDVLAIARSFQLTAYDAAYLWLAQREGLPLATLDKSLRMAASKAGVKLA
jgi:predicted nucleic acid-binding protein